MMTETPDNLTPVKGHSDLFRDNDTGMIVSINRYSSAHYKKIREQKLKEKQEIEALKSDVGDIKSMLKKLLEKING